MKNLVSKINTYISKNFQQLKDGHPKFDDTRYHPVDFSNDNYHILEQNETNKNIAFIDGGNAEIIKGPSFSLQLIRIYFNLFSGKKITKQKKIETYVSIVTENKKGKIYYNIKYFPLKEEYKKYLTKEVSIYSMNKKLRTGRFRIPISKIGRTTRRLLEWSVSTHIIELLEENDILVKDGSLQTSITNESYYSNQCYKKALDQNVIITGLSKTCNLLTTTGKSLAGMISKNAPHALWYYYPVVHIQHPDHRAEMLFVNLNKNSSHVFRFEILKEQFNNVKEILYPLINNSKDYRFPGYPYGLIDVDRKARVTGEESKMHKAMFQGLASTHNNEIQAINAHEILDDIIK